MAHFTNYKEKEEKEKARQYYEPQGNAKVDFKVSGLLTLLVVGIISYGVGKKAGYAECVQNIAKITNTIVE